MYELSAKNDRLISVHYTDEESPFEMAEMTEILGDITHPQNEGTVLSPQNQRVTSPIPKTGIPETGMIINTELNNNKHKKVSDGLMRESVVTEVSNWTSDFAQSLVWEEDAVDAVASFTAPSCSSAYVFVLDETLQDDRNAVVYDEDCVCNSALDSEPNNCVSDDFEDEGLSDVSSVFGSRTVVQHSDRGTSYPDVLCDEDLFAELYDDFETECSDACMNPYAQYSENDFKEMEAFYNQSMEDLEAGEEDFHCFDDCDDSDWFIDRLPILRDAKHNPFIDLTEEDVEKALREYRKDKEQRNKQTKKQEGVLDFDCNVSVVDVKNNLHTKPFMDDSAFTEPKNDGNEKNNFEKQKEPDFPASNGIQEDRDQTDRLYPNRWCTKENPSRGTVYPCDSKNEESVDPLERAKKLCSEKVAGRKTVSQFSDLLFVRESFPDLDETDVRNRNLPLAILQIQRNRGSPE